MNHTVSAIAVRRAERFSPNSVEKDDLILQAVGTAIRSLAPYIDTIMTVEEDDLADTVPMADVYFSMARSEDALHFLDKTEKRGCTVINSARAVFNCQRSLLDRLMRQAGIAMPPPRGNDGYWLKRGDAAAQSHNDVIFCKNEKEVENAMSQFAQRGITDVVTSSHVKGDLVKFYGVSQRMFRYFYPTDDGTSKFGDETLNGTAHHYRFDSELLQQEVFRLAQLTGVEVYGGDAIIDNEGYFYIIDFNDWPSFSRCREEAALAIAQTIIEKINVSTTGK